MNGHGNAEALAFALLSARDRWRADSWDCGDAPIFIFAAGHEAGDRELRERLAPACLIPSPTQFDACLVDSSARQLVSLTACADAEPVVHSADAMRGTRERAVNAQEIIVAQHGSLEALRFSGGTVAPWGRAFTNLTADYAIYLRLLFPRAKFLFVHANPLDSFQRCIEAMRARGGSSSRDPNWAPAFVERWCQLVTSFTQWVHEVGGAITTYDRVAGDDVVEIEDYLEARLSAPRQPAGEPAGASSIERHPDDTKIISERAGELADRLGYRLEASSADAHRHSANGIACPDQIAEARSRSGRPNCAVLVPTMRYIEPECEQSLRELENRGYTVCRLHGCSAIDSARNRLATDALEHGFEETLWIDADVLFDPDDVERLRAHDLPIVSGIYAKKGERALATAAIPGTASILLGKDGGVIEILYAATGFLLVRSGVYEAIRRRFDLPVCNPRAPHRSVPFFMPMLEHFEGEMSYLPEDYAFSRRARMCGFKVMADTTIRLWHIGAYAYGFEDAGGEVARVDTYEHFLRNPGKGSH